MDRKLFIAISAIFAFLLTFSSCSNKDSGTSPELTHLDSILNRTRKMDTLIAWAARYEEQKKYLEAEKVLRKLGNVSRESDNYIKALEYHNRALTIAQELNNTTEIILCLNQIGTDYRRMGSYEDASSYHYLALQLCETYSDKTSDFALKNKVISLNGIGNIYLTLGNLTEAIDVFKEALDGESRLGSHLGMAINYANIGSIYEQKQMYDLARIYYEYSMEHNKTAKSRLGISLCHGHFGRLAEIAGNLDEALQEYRAAYDVMEKSSDRWHWLDACVALIRVNIAKGNMPAAKIYLDKAEVTANDIRSKDYFALVYEMKYLYYERQGNLRQALDNYILSKTYADSVMNLNNVNHVNNMRVRYETEKKELKIADLKNENRQILWLSIAGGAVLLLGLVALFFLWRWTVQKKRIAEQQKLLADQQVKRMQQEKQLIATQALLDGETQERTRLARDLHDGLGGMLTGVKLNLEGMKNGALLEQTDVNNFNKALAMLNESLNELRRVAHHLMPEALSRYGLKPAINDFCHGLSSNIILDWFGSEERLDPKLEAVIYRSIHELVNNALKYANASQIMVQVMQESDRIAFTVQDDGAGFDPSAVHCGMGLSNIRTRVASFGGSITIDSKIGEGTEINVEFKY
jgi:signal transduction histidine kinase